MIQSNKQEEQIMRPITRIVTAVVAGIALGAVAVQGLHAQAKKKAYSVTETELIDAAVLAAYLPLLQSAQKAVGQRNFNTSGGRTIATVGTAPARVAIAEWDSLEQAEAFYKSKAWNDLAPQRNKALKTVRQFFVEVVN